MERIRLTGAGILRVSLRMMINVRRKPLHFVKLSAPYAVPTPPFNRTKHGEPEVAPL
jgi:hypothetical protein